MLRYFLCADCFGRKILNKSNGVVAVDRLFYFDDFVFEFGKVNM
jgi:hypothetical protein